MLKIAAKKVGFAFLNLSIEPGIWRDNLGENATALPLQKCSRIMTVASPELLLLWEPGGGRDEAAEHGDEGRASCGGEPHQVFEQGAGVSVPSRLRPCRLAREGLAG